MKYQVVLVKNGAASAIDQIRACVGYSSHNYIIDCERNADEEWIRMLKSGVVLELDEDMAKLIVEAGKAEYI